MHWKWRDHAAPTRPGDDHKVIAGEKFGAGDHDQNQTERKGYTAEDSAKRKAKAGVGGNEGKVERPESDKPAGEHAKRSL